jgi:uncharacterized protein involved in response to NO
MRSLCRAPYRLFFPLALAVGWVGMWPWVAFGHGWTRAWPGFPHALTMTQGFLLALVVGFLGTMIPRRAGSAPMSRFTLLVLAAAVIAVPAAALLGAIRVVELVYVTALLILGGFAARAFVRRTERRPPPPSFILVPIGLVLGMAGAVLIGAYLSGRAEAWALSLGRQLAQQGLMLALIMAVVPLVGPILATGAPSADPPLRRLVVLRLAHLVAGISLAASFLLEEWVSSAGGLLLRATVVAVELLAAGRLLAPLAVPGLHRRMFRIALWVVLVGLMVAGLAPVARIPALHLTFVGGFSLLALAVTVHVTLVHGGREREARGRPRLVALAGVFTLAAAAVRYSAEQVPQHYFHALTLAATLWIVAALLWAIYVIRRLVDESETTSGTSGQPHRLASRAPTN